MSTSSRHVKIGFDLPGIIAAQIRSYVEEGQGLKATVKRLQGFQRLGLLRCPACGHEHAWPFPSESQVQELIHECRRISSYHEFAEAVARRYRAYRHQCSNCGHGCGALPENTLEVCEGN